MGRFVKGQSGNPSGRPKKPNNAIREQMATYSGELIRKTVEQALEGDMTAMKLLLDRIAPPLKPEARQTVVELPQDATLTQVARAFVEAAAAGRIQASDASSLISALNGSARLKEIDEISTRLAAIEKFQKTHHAGAPV